MEEKNKILECAVDAIITIDAQDTITAWNPAAQSIFGWSTEEVMGKKFSETLLPEITRKKYFERLEHYNRTGETTLLNTPLENNVLHRSGHEFPVEFYATSTQNINGNSFIIFARDITERKYRDLRIRQAYQSQSVTNAILKISLEHTSIDEMLSRSLDHILSLESIKLIPRGAILLVEDHPDILELKVQRGFTVEQLTACGRVPFGKCHCGRAATTGTIQFVECIDHKHDILVKNMKPHGHYCVPIQSGSNILGVLALYLKEGHCRRIEEEELLLAITNILAGVIERKKVEEQRFALIDSLKTIITDLLDEKKFNESIIQSLNVGLMVLDLKGRIVTSNPVGRKILEQFAYAFYIDGKSLGEIVGINAAAEMMKIKNPMPGKTDELRLLTRKNEERFLRYTAAPREDSTGKKVGIIVSFNDVTRMKYIQEEMEKMNRLSTVAEIASAVAHEVRNPLAGIKTMSQSIEENMAADDENREYIKRIIKQVDRLNELLTEFFTYAKPGSAKKVETSLFDIVSETKPLIKLKLHKKNISLSEEYGESLPDILVDPNQLQQVFLNLMLNSIDAVSVDGRISIRANRLEVHDKENYCLVYPGLKEGIDYVVVYFSDNGPGMTVEVAEKAFEPFFTTKHDGSGLGLSIVYRILKTNNALIYIDCTQTSGTTFIMFFEAGKKWEKS
ncbi:MAG: PAS domain S-box protein [Proteobacteria bacterium]|nr:PAS domain S-box protein [Pseudomonadota bacterium]MBU1710524.1 PAS domain S-box protein [Pseudomonadota bacterium]